MRRHAYKFFPTLVHYCKEVLSPEELELVAEHCLAAGTGRHDALTGDSRSSFGTTSRLVEDLESSQPALGGLRSRLEALLADYAAMMGFDDV
ncbi:MAG: hypothetical protein RLZZ393_1038, partial [Pseudomonadota bacterium]